MEIPDCIIPAAGYSRRMGAWKPQLPWEDTTIVERVVQEAQKAGCRVIVVGGYRFRRLRKLLHNYTDLVLLQADNWKIGMGATLCSALDSVRTRQFFVVPADMPRIRADDYIRLAAMDKASVIRPVFNNKPGHPVLIDALLIEKLLLIPKNRGFQEFLAAYKPVLIGWDHAGVIQDMDTMDELSGGLEQLNFPERAGVR